MASAWIILGLTVTAIGFVISMISYGIPFWIKNDTIHYGLWAKCSDVNTHNELKCNWYWENNFSYLKSQTVWFQATVGLMGLGILILFFTFLMGITALCCCRENFRTGFCMSSFLLLSFLMIASAIVLYIIKNMDKNNMKLKEFDWAVWIGIGGAASALLATLLFTCAGCHDRYAGYDRGYVQ